MASDAAPGKSAVSVLLLVAVLAASSGAIFVRLAHGLPPLAMAFWRTSLASVALAPFGRSLGRKDSKLAALAGIALAFHFWTWIASVQRTTVLRSTLLVSLSPIWAGLLAFVTGEDVPTGRFWLGVGIAIGGLGCSAGAGSSHGDLLGDLLALLGGIFCAIYLSIGRDVRQRVGIGCYGTRLCGCSAACLALVALVTGTPLWPTCERHWLAVCALAVGPQLTGHIGFNFALEYLPAATVAAAILLEPLAASFLAALLLGEVPTPQQLYGAVIVITGLAVI
ncbi:unnamed protein product [Symbiodinium natans]|uniref:EamA domain-containing protein n=1 Tax=Symbiodinium natans TaxID=878477 RepID=A0A812TPR8_9DINO|nr:unnamed protein product [Symbiodinium natans]